MKKILIVDDRPEVRLLVERTLCNSGYRVFTGVCGEDAVRIATEEMPHLIIMDVRMPGRFDGLEATRRIKNNPGLNSIFILVLTGLLDDDIIESARVAGADDYIIKPFSPLALISKIDEILLD